MDTQGKIIGFGGVFIRSKNPENLRAWYRENLNIEIETWGKMFSTEEVKRSEYQIFSVFNANSDYFPINQSYLINWMVDDLDKLCEKLTQKNIEIIKRENSEFGKFAWIVDGDQNKLELWEPPVK